MKFTIAALAAIVTAVQAGGCESPLTSSSGTTWDVSSLAKNVSVDENGFVPWFDETSMYSTSINTTFAFFNFNFCETWCINKDSCGLARLNETWVAQTAVDDDSVTEMVDLTGAITGVQWTSSSDVKCFEDPEKNYSVKNIVMCDTNPRFDEKEVSAWKFDCVHEIKIYHKAGCPLSTAEDETETTTIEQSTRSLLDYFSWTEVNEQKAQEWIKGKEQDAEARKQNWADAWKNYQDKIAQPWNDFVEKAEDLSIEDTLSDLETQEEVINYVANNTFIQGQPLIEVFPEIEGYLNSISQQQESIGEILNFDAFKVTPRNVLLADVEPTAHEVGNWAEDKIISYGYDKDIVEQWLQDTKATWQELEQTQKEEAAKQAKNDIREAGDYIKKILDNAVVDIQQNQEEFQAGYQNAIDKYADDLKSMLDDFVEENVGLLDDYVNMGYAAFQQELEKPIDFSISFAAVQGTPETVEEVSNIQYAVIAFFTVPWFTIIFAIYAKFFKGNNKEISAIEEPLLSQKEDEEPKCIL